MFRKLLLLSLAASSILARAEETTPAKERPYSINAYLEFRHREDLRKRPENRTEQNVNEVSIGGHHQIEPSLAAEAELSVERVSDESTFIIKEAFVDWRPIADQLQLTVGQQFMSVGYLNALDNWFSSSPSYVERLFTAKKGIDLGAEITYTPLAQRWLYLQVGQYAGRIVRPEDERDGSPESPPRLASLKSEGEFYRAFVTYFEHDLAYFDPVEAWGVGFELTSPKDWLMKPSVLVERWSFAENQKDGPDQENEAYTAYGYLTWWKLAAGYRWSETRAKLKSAQGSTELPAIKNRLVHVDFKPLEALIFRFEQVKETQDLVLRDEWLGRVIVDWAW